MIGKMSHCSFCGELVAAPLTAGALELCVACEAQLILASPRAESYRWWLSAVRRALFA